MKYLVDENLALSKRDLLLFRHENIVNTHSFFPRGEDDNEIILKAIKEDWVICTKDIVLFIKAITNGVTVLFVNEDYKIVELVRSTVVPPQEYIGLYNYYKNRFKIK